MVKTHSEILFSSKEDWIMTENNKVKVKWN